MKKILLLCFIAAPVHPMGNFRTFMKYATRFYTQSKPITVPLMSCLAAKKAVEGYVSLYDNDEKLIKKATKSPLLFYAMRPYIRTTLQACAWHKPEAIASLIEQHPSLMDALPRDLKEHVIALRPSLYEASPFYTRNPHLFVVYAQREDLAEAAAQKYAMSINDGRNPSHAILCALASPKALQVLQEPISRIFHTTPENITFNMLAQSSCVREFLQYHAEECGSHFKYFKPLIEQQLHSLDDQTLISLCKKLSTEDARMFINMALDNHIGTKKIALIAQHLSDDLIGEHAILERLPKPAQVESAFLPYIAQSTAYLLTPENKHWIKKIAWFVSSESYDFKKIIEQEIKEQSQQRHSFYHGQMSGYAFFSDLTTDLIHALHKQGIVTKPLRRDFMYIQNRDTILVESTKTPCADGDTDEHPAMISVNAYLYGNLQKPGSCTVRYLTINQNVWPATLSTYDYVFKALQIPHSIFQKYEQELCYLQYIHAVLFTQGRLLQISIPNEQIDTIVALSKTGRDITVVKTDRATLKTMSAFVQEVDTEPTSIPFETIDRHAEGTLQLTREYTLNPSQDMRIYAYDPKPTDKALYEKYKTRRTDLLKKIAHDMAQHPDTKGKKFELYCPSLQERLKKTTQALSQWD